MFSSPGRFFADLIALMIAYLSPLAGIVHVVLILILVDLATGVYASRRSKQRITSRGLRKTIEKFVLYTLAIICTYLIEREILGFRMVNIVAGYIALVELKSILENTSKILGGDLMSQIYQAIKDKFTRKTINSDE